MSRKGPKRSKKSAPNPPACPPLHQPSVFPGYLNYIFNDPGSPEKISKKFLEQVSKPVPESKEEHDADCLYGNRSSNVTAIEVLSLVPNRRETGADDVHQSLANFA